MAIRIAAANPVAPSDDKKETGVQSTGKKAGSLELGFASGCVNDLIQALVNAGPDADRFAWGCFDEFSNLAPRRG
jgi:hypothetical protein